MSLSLIPAPTADRSAADIRAVQPTVTSKSNVASDQDTAGADFAKLLDDVGIASAAPIVADPVPVPAANIPEIPASRDSLTTPSKDASALADQFGETFLTAPPQGLANAVDPGPIATLVGVVSAEQSAPAEVGQSTLPAQNRRPLSNQPHALGASVPPIHPVDPGQQSLLQPAAAESTTVNADARADPTLWAEKAADGSAHDWQPPSRNVDPEIQVAQTGTLAQIALRYADPTPQPSSHLKMSATTTPEGLVSGPSVNVAAQHTISAQKSDNPSAGPSLITPNQPTDMQTRPSELASVLLADTPTVSSKAVQPAHPQLLAAYAALTQQMQPINSERATAEPDLNTAAQNRADSADGAGGATQSNSALPVRASVHAEGIPNQAGHALRLAKDDSVNLRQPATNTDFPRLPRTEKPQIQSVQAAPAEVLLTDASATTPQLVNPKHTGPDPLSTDRAHSSTQNGRTIALHVASQLAQAAVQTTSGTTDITLNPKELGHVKLSLQAVDGTMYVAIAAERPETAELMRRHIDSLAQEFRGLGYQDVSFSFAGRQGGNGSGPDPGFGQSGSPEQEQLTESSAELPADRYIPRRAAAQTGGTGLDLRL